MKYRILTSTTRFKKAKLLVFIILSLYKYNRSVLQCLRWPITSNGNCIKIPDEWTNQYIFVQPPDYVLFKI